MENKSGHILVTGASGYLASWIVKQLVDQGYTVHGTVRNINDKSKVEHLSAFAENAPGQLKLFECDLLSEGSFDPALKGCEIVIHTASPYFIEQTRNIEADLVKPAVQGTRNILNSVNRHPAVKKVVLTSSVVALYNNAKDLSARNDYMVKEDDVNENQDMRYNSYAYSKTKAEQAAWEMHRAQDHWELITIHPGAIFGPSLSRRSDATSINMMLQFIDGSYKAGVPKLWLGLVDVRDVAQIHVMAALNENTNKKYIAMSKSLSLLEIARLFDLEKYQISNKLPKKEVPKFLVWLIAPLLGLQRKFIRNNVNYPINFNNQRSKLDFKFSYLPPGQTLNDHLEQLVADKLV